MQLLLTVYGVHTLQSILSLAFLEVFSAVMDIFSGKELRCAYPNSACKVVFDRM
jgi:hypothetical protein